MRLLRLFKRKNVEANNRSVQKIYNEDQGYIVVFYGNDPIPHRVYFPDHRVRDGLRDRRILVK